MYTPERINNLNSDDVFVFGSNLNGLHSGGAAYQAKEFFGAEEGVEEGLTGMCYAFPTLDQNMKKQDRIALIHSKEKLYSTARALPEKIFWLTKVGCGIAGFTELEMKSIFEGERPNNIIFPKGW